MQAGNTRLQTEAELVLRLWPWRNRDSNVSSLRHSRRSVFEIVGRWRDVVSKGEQARLPADVFRSRNVHLTEGESI